MQQHAHIDSTDFNITNITTCAIYSPDRTLLCCLAKWTDASCVQASSDRGRKALWTVNAPEVLRKGCALLPSTGVSCVTRAAASRGETVTSNLAAAARRIGHACRYEAEEDPGVCAAMERTAELFIAGNIVPDVVEEPTAADGTGNAVDQEAA